MAEQFKDAVRLFPDNKSCSKYNCEKLRQLEKPICQFNATNLPSRGKNYGEDNFFGLKIKYRCASMLKFCLPLIYGQTRGL